jgi:hypothetical protein
MSIDLKKLTTIQIEWGSVIMANAGESMMTLRLLSILLADTKTLLAARKDETLLEPFFEQAADISADDAEEAVTGFFERWTAYQGRILRSAGQTVTMTNDPNLATLRPKSMSSEQAEGVTDMP